MRERRRRGVDVAGWWCKTQDICDGTSASRASPSDHKNTSDKNSKAVLRISVITLIRTDTTLDLSQKAEKGKSLLRRPADESRFSGPQAMTLSRQFYDPGEGAAKKAAAGASLGSPRPRPIFRPCIPPWGCPGGLVLVVRGCLAAPGVGRSPRAAPTRAGRRRATLLAAPARLAAFAWPRACFLLCGPLRLRREV